MSGGEGGVGGGRMSEWRREVWEGVRGERCGKVR